MISVFNAFSFEIPGDDCGNNVSSCFKAPFVITGDDNNGVSIGEILLNLLSSVLDISCNAFDNELTFSEEFSGVVWFLSSSNLVIFSTSFSFSFSSFLIEAVVTIKHGCSCSWFSFLTVISVFDFNGLVAVFFTRVEDFLAVMEVEFLGFTVIFDETEEFFDKDFEGNELTFALTLA